MSEHRFKVGETVHLSFAASRALGCSAIFTVVATLPREGKAREYRVRSEQELYDRVVIEDYLEIVHSPASLDATHL